MPGEVREEEPLFPYHGGEMKSFEFAEEKVKALCFQHGADRMLVITDSNVDALTRSFLYGVPRLVLEAGERSKTLEGAEKVWDFLIDEGAVRRSVLINLGGGMICDLGGFAAATFKRGIGCVNVPTTLLAAVDAAIGGKTGINYRGLKNEVGAFAMPLGVVPLTALFSSLPMDEWLSGVGEALKTGLLDSEELFEMASSEEFIVKREPEVVGEVTRRCAAYKERIVEEDFREGGKRRILNLGHTAGHAIESLMMAKGEAIPHGVAVAHGLMVALEKSKEEAGLPEDIVSKYRNVLERFFPPLRMSEADWRQAEMYMAHDKKNREAGRPEWVLLKNIGEAVE